MLYYVIKGRRIVKRGAKLNLDNILGNIHKRQRYLFFRFLVITLLIFFTYRPMFNNEIIDVVLILNTTIFLIGPLWVEYTWGIQAYNRITNLSRIVGFFYTVIVLFFCVMGLMQGYTITDLKGNEINTSEIFNFTVSLKWFKAVIWLTPILLLVDCVFTLSRREVELYKLEDALYTTITDSKPFDIKERKTSVDDLAARLVKIGSSGKGKGD